MPLWIIATLTAAFAQNIRFMLQKHLKSTELSSTGATLSRFLFSAPLLIVGLSAYLWQTGETLPEYSGRFFLFAMLGGVAQILATVCVVALFAERNFAVGITFKKTEVLQTVLLGAVVLQDTISPLGMIAVGLGFVAVLLLADGKNTAVQGSRFFNRAAGLGLGSGLLFAVSAIGYRGASLEIVNDNPLLRAGFTLGFVVCFQTIATSIYLMIFEKGEVTRVIKSWRVSSLLGLTSLIGSYGWFTAFTLQSAAYVKALGQIELLFSFLTGLWIFKEKSSPRELFAMGLLCISIVMFVLVT
ncbi:MAG: EamA/RhaT family transporter [Halocynthiibacter sp.]